MCQRVRHFFSLLFGGGCCRSNRADRSSCRQGDRALHGSRPAYIDPLFCLTFTFTQSRRIFLFFIFRATWINRLLYIDFNSIFFYLNELNDPNTIMYTITAYFLEKMSHIVTLGYSAHRSLTWRKDPLWVYSAQDGNHDRIELHIRRKNSYGPHM